MISTDLPEPKREDFAHEEMYVIALRLYLNYLRGMLEIEQAHNAFLMKQQEAKKL